MVDRCVGAYTTAFLLIECVCDRHQPAATRIMALARTRRNTTARFKSESHKYSISSSGIFQLYFGSYQDIFDCASNGCFNIDQG
jgi:hypothetical protein